MQAIPRWEEKRAGSNDWRKIAYGFGMSQISDSGQSRRKESKK